MQNQIRKVFSQNISFKIAALFSWFNPEEYLETCQISKMKRFEAKSCKLIAKHSIIDAWQGSEYASATNNLFQPIQFLGKVKKVFFT